MKPDLENRFVELATRTLASNAEIHLTASGELRRRIETNAPSLQTLGEACESLERADQRPRRRWWTAALAGVAAVAAIVVFSHTLVQLREFMSLNPYVSTDSNRGILLPDPMRHLSRQQKLILHGSDSATSGAERWRSLWDSDPKNPGYLLEYSVAYCRESNELSPEILQAAARIDPDNAWYQVILAAAQAKKAVKRDQVSYRAVTKRPTYTVLDETALSSALELLHQNAGRPKLAGADVNLLKRRVSIVPERRDFVSQFPRHVMRAMQTCGIIELRDLSNAIAVQAGRLAKQNDADGFQKLLSDWKWLVERSARDGETLVDILVANATFNNPLAELADAAKALNLEKESLVIDSLRKHHEELRDQVRKKSRVDPNAKLVDTKSSLLTGLTGLGVWAQLDEPLRVTDEDLKPLRYVDHAVAGRMHAVASIAIFGTFAGLAALSRQRVGPYASALSKRIADLSPPGDQFRIFLGGLVFPVLWYFLVTRLTPFTAREWSMKPSGLMLPALQLGSLTLLILTATSVTASGLLSRRAGILGLNPRFPKLGIIATISAALAIPVTGALHVIPEVGNLLFFVGCGLAAIAALWLLCAFASHVLGRPLDGSLRRATIARLLIPSWVSAVLVMPALAMFHYSEERHWIQKDRLIDSSPDAVTGQERKVTQQLRKELLAKLASLEEVR